MFSYTITLGNKKVKLLTNARTAVYYREIFGEDLLSFMLVDAPKGSVSDADAVDVAQKVCFVMMKQAQKIDMREVTIEDYYDWLENQSQMELINKYFEIIDVYKENMIGLSEAKKKADEQSAD